MKSLFVSVVCSYIKKLGQAISHGIVLEKVSRAIKSNKNPWWDKLNKNATNYFGKYFFKLMSNVNFGATMENVRKRRDIKLVTTN